MDLKVPIKISDELSEDIIDSTGLLDLASGEIYRIEYEDYDLEGRGLPADNDDYEFTVGTLSQGDYIGQTALTRERVAAGVVAIDEVTVLRVPVASLDRLVHRKPELARDIGKAIGQQRLRATPEAAGRCRLVDGPVGVALHIP